MAAAPLLPKKQRCLLRFPIPVRQSPTKPCGTLELPLWLVLLQIGLKPPVPLHPRAASRYGGMICTGSEARYGFWRGMQLRVGLPCSHFSASIHLDRNVGVEHPDRGHGSSAIWIRPFNRTASTRQMFSCDVHNLNTLAGLSCTVMRNCPAFWPSKWPLQTDGPV